MSGWVNYDHALRQIEAWGIRIDRSRLTFDTRIQRWLVDGEDREKRGWTRLREWTSKHGHTYIVGVFGVWHGTDDGKTKIELPSRTDLPELTKEDLAAIREAHKEAERKLKEERAREAKQAASWAAIVWSQCQPCEEHEYLTRKGIKAHGLRLMAGTDGMVFQGLDDSNFYRLSQADGALVVPMHDQHGNVSGIQFIYPRGHKRAQKIERDKEFWPSGMAMGGTFGLVGPVQRNGILLVCEGYATAASLHEATGLSVAYAFSANNLIKAGKILRKAYPRLRLLFCADDDYLTENNPGCTAAAASAAAIELSAWTKPDFKDEAGNDRRDGKKLTDFNDLAVLTGLPLTLADQINATLEELKWRDAPVARDFDEGGGGSERRAAVSVMTLDDAVARFIPLDDGTGKFLFDTWTNKIVHKDQMVAVLPAGMRGDDVKRHPVWQQRGAFYLDQVGFDPACSDIHVKLNTWSGWPMQPVEGRCGALLTLLEYLCSAEDNGREVMQWILRWLAYPLQHPGAKMASAIIMHGPQGTGKSTLFEVVASIYGRRCHNQQMNYSVWLDQKALQDNFNADWENKLFVTAEEVVNGSDKWQLKNELKALVTSDTIRIRRLFRDGYPTRNRVNLVFLSNENQPLPLENDDRRHLVVYTPPELEPEFYDDVFLEIENGGVEAFYHYLMNLDLGDFHPKKKPPMTVAKRDLIELSLPSEARFINEWVGGFLDLPVCPCRSMDLYDVYLKWCRRNGESRPRPSNQFLGYIGRLHEWKSSALGRLYETYKCTGPTKPARMVFPPTSILQQHGRDHPPEKGVSEWLTECALDFAEKGSEDSERAAA
jgi:putative DNA primase/helicase